MLNKDFGATHIELPKVVGGRIYGTGIEIWAGFGPVWQLLRPIFSCFLGQKKMLKIL